MAKGLAKFWAVPLALLTLKLTLAAALCPVADAQDATSSESKSWTESISSGIKRSFNKLGQAVNPKPSAFTPGPEDDAISLKSKGKPGPDSYVAFARVFEERNDVADAEQYYRLALKEKPDHLPALLGYAQLEERLNKPNEALKLYQRAVKAYPQQASVYNNVGLYYARLGRLDEAVAALSRATRLDPQNRLYRNNVAAVLVDQDRTREAFDQMREVLGEAAAHYNLGFLLNKKGKKDAAMRQFALALKADPSMDAARRWVDYLQTPTAEAPMPQPATAGGATVNTRLAMPSDDALLSSEKPSPQRLPPVALRHPPSEGATLPGISYDRPADSAAPLPPPLINNPVRPQPSSP